MTIHTEDVKGDWNLVREVRGEIDAPDGYDEVY
jgi:hypothetical protein